MNPVRTIKPTPAQFATLEALGAGPAVLLAGKRHDAWTSNAGDRYLVVRGNVRRVLISARWIQHDGARGTWSLTDAGREIAAAEETRRGRVEVVA